MYKREKMNTRPKKWQLEKKKKTGYEFLKLVSAFSRNDKREKTFFCDF